MTTREFMVSADNRRELHVVASGALSGPVVFSLHGTPASARLHPSHVADAAERGLCLVGYDRPGYGGSSAHPGRRVADAASDVRAIADHLSAERFAVWGISGGGPHALACAALLPTRLAACASLAGPAPHDAAGMDWWAGMGEENLKEFGAAIEGPEPLNEYLTEAAAQENDATAEELVEAWDTLLADVDRTAMSGDLAEFLLAAQRDGLRAGVLGWQDDDLAFVHPWGFDPAAIRIPLQLWHGRHDKFVPIAHGEWLADRIPQADVHLSDVDGHLTLYVDRISDVHAWLAQHV